ncbi:MAG: hypothetical protein LBB51_05340 [Zoogloeaceae bacterium]|jgi:hypothetical protein|nr:hypothetical protein [Zoogloeaceae bacterium]
MAALLLAISQYDLDGYNVSRLVDYLWDGRKKLEKAAKKAEKREKGTSGPDIGVGWEDVLDMVANILVELPRELHDTQIFQVKHIALGFVDGNLVSMK